MSNKASLKIDWASHEACVYATRNWHYTKCMPCGKTVKVGAWEDGVFIGVVIFSRGTNRDLGTPYGLGQDECCELTRVALRNHKSQVSRIVAIALRFLKRHSSGLRLVVSFAAKQQGHHGGIYQAGGWVYNGETAKVTGYSKNGMIITNRAVSSLQKSMGKTRRQLLDDGIVAIVENETKHRYLMPLDNDMRKQLAPMAKPYPKKKTDTCVGSADSGTPANQAGGGGVSPTPTLHSRCDKKAAE